MLNKNRLQTLKLVLALTPIPLLWCFALEEEWLDQARNWSIDTRFKLRGEIPSPGNIVYVDIDSISLDAQEIGGWPWSRHYFAQATQTLVNRAGVKAIGIDVVLSDAGVAESVDLRKLVEGNREFARYLFSEPPVVLASAFSADFFRDINGELFMRQLPRVADPNLPPVEDIEGPEVPSFITGQQAPYTPAGVGLIDTDDGNTRRVPLYAPSNVRIYYHLAVEVLRRYWDLGYEGVRVDGDYLIMEQEDGTVVRRIPLREQQMLEVNWFSPWLSEENNPRFSFRDVYAASLFIESDDQELIAIGEEFFSNPIWKDAIVLIGPTDPLMQDLGPAPFDAGPVPKVGVHGNVIKTILVEKYLVRLDRWQIYLLVFILTMAITAMAVWGGKSSLPARVLGLLVLGGYVGLAIHWFNEYHLVLPLITPVGSTLSTTLIAVGWQVIQEQKAKGRIKGMFGTYLSPTVVNTMIDSGKDPELGGHDAEITSYFSDIQSFSAFSEVLSSSQLGELLNEYLTVCTDIITEEGGTLDKYIGDAVVAMFGAPLDLENHAYKACLTTQLVHRRLDELREKWTMEGDKWPGLVHRMRTRIGLNTGECMIGNMGSRTRFNYTMMGDNVNLAARMESGAKSWGTFTMVTESTKLACEKYGGDRIVFRPLGKIVVKGRTQPVPIHEITGLREDMSDKTLECLDLFRQGMDKYYGRDWVGAATLFERSAALEPLLPGKAAGVTNSPSLVYQGIVAEMEDHPPPPDWDGVRVMTEK